jgi:hypothetical protein
MSDVPGGPQEWDRWTGDAENGDDDVMSSGDIQSGPEVRFAQIASETSEADRAEALARATVARAEAARRATAARAEALRQISSQHVEAVRVAENDRDATVKGAHERYESEVRVAEEEAREAIESACEESTTALEAAHLALVRARETAAATAGSRETAVDDAETRRSVARHRASEERTQSVFATYFAHSEALESADAARSHELESVRSVDEPPFPDPES